MFLSCFDFKGFLILKMLYALNVGYQFANWSNFKYSFYQLNSSHNRFSPALCSMGSADNCPFWVNSIRLGFWLYTKIVYALIFSPLATFQ